MTAKRNIHIYNWKKRAQAKRAAAEADLQHRYLWNTIDITKQVLSQTQGKPGISG